MNPLIWTITFITRLLASCFREGSKNFKFHIKFFKSHFFLEFHYIQIPCEGKPLHKDSLCVVATAWIISTQGDSFVLIFFIWIDKYMMITWLTHENYVVWSFHMRIYVYIYIVDAPLHKDSPCGWPGARHYIRIIYASCYSKNLDHKQSL